jgi:predicted RNA-binding protein YlxR (DUF448 family)
VPQRRCLGCGTSSPKGELVRFVNGEGLEIDFEMKHQGRGAYLHRSLQCFVKGSVSKRWAQALRVSGTDLKVLRGIRAAAERFGWAI